MKNRTSADKLAVIANQKTLEKKYWLEQLAGFTEKSNFPFDLSGENITNDRLETATSRLQGDLFLQLGKISKNSDIKLYMVLATGLAVLLRKYTSSNDIAIGTPIYKQESDSDFINTVLVLRNRFEDTLTFKELLLQVRNSINCAVENQNYPIDYLVEHLRVSHRENEYPFFDIGIFLQNVHYKKYFADIRFHMLFDFNRADDCLEVTVEYNPSLYRLQTVEQIIRHFNRLLETALANVDTPLSDIDVLSAEEKERLLFEFNGREEEYPCDKTFHGLFEEQVEQTPDRIAVIGFGSTVETLRATSLQISPTSLQITYRQLNEKSNQLTGLLRNKGVKPDSVTAVMAQRSPGMIIAIIAVMKAGGAYLPVDPTYPAERIDFMLQDSQTQLLVTQEHLKATTPVNFHGMVITIEDKAINLEAAENPASVNRQTDLVYVIYTSGSTGKPKGVMVQHDNFVNVAIAWQKEYRLQEIEVCLLQVASFSFDVFAGDLARTFLNSGKMVINPAPVLDPDTLYKLINSHRISLFESTPSYIIPFLRYVYENNLGAGIHSLKLLILGSDTCQYRDFKEAVMRFGNQMRIVNSYGVTEATIDSSYYEPLPGEDLPSSGIVPIGKPLPNVKFYILDRNGALLPLGVPGELFIGGKSIARGYLYREELTAERFISPSATGNPFEKGFPGPSQNFCLDKSFSGGLYRRGRLYKKAPLVYRTGDRARWLHNGNVEFLGRIDYQVKVRGYRIELGEIEHCILEYQDVKQAIVVEKGKESSDKYLCAYIISDKIIEPEELRRFLGQRLPDYMIPWFYVQMDRFPLTPNGKIDRNALPEPETFQEIAYVAPRNELETELVHMWTAVLAVDEKKIGIDNRFFDLGGNSLAAIILIARIHKAFNATILLEDIFRIQTIRGIAEYINDSEKTQYHAIAIAEKKEYYPLSSAQKRLYLLQQLDNESNTYNIPLIFSLQGALDKEKFVDTFKKIIQRHESFRTSFMLIKDEPVQKVHREVELQLEYYDLAEKDHEEKQIHHSIQAFVRPFDLSQAPLLRVGLLKIAGKEFILIVDMHHIISDGVSTQVLVQDFSDLYSGKYLPEINLQYKDYAEWQNREKVSKKVLEQGDYWKKQFEGEIPVLELLTDYTRPAVQTFEGSSINFEINSETTGALKNLALEAGATLYIVLAALYTVFLSRLSSQEDIIVGSPVAGRRHADLENIIGMFVNTLALRNYPSSEKKFADFLEEVKERTLKAFENQEYQYEDLVEEVVLTRDVSRNPLFDTMFLVQEAGSQKTESTGLKLIPYASEHKISKFDLTLAATEVEESLRFTFEYCTKLFKQETVERFIVYFENIIRSIAKNKNQRICDLEILPEEEKKRILFEFNDIEAEYPKNKTIHQLFTEQAERIPDNIALVGAGSQTCPICITYNQLNNQSGWLAGLLIEKGVLPNNIIGIMMERSVEMIIGLLGILKSGSAYMPIDPAYPQERIDYMLKDSAAKILINEKFFAPLFFKKAGRRGGHHSSIINHQSNLAYIIYTSGSTGRPKGVLIKHKNFVNLINFHQSIFEENQESRMSQVANPAFDAMGFEVWPCLASGAALHIADNEILLSPIQMRDWLIRRGITISFQPTVLAEYLLEEWWPNEGVALKSLCAAGDKLSRYPTRTYPFKLYNLYGPTEDTVWTTWALVEPGPNFEGFPSIGKPVANHRVYILNSNLILQPVGVPGELCISGVGLAEGYLNNPGLTAERFIKYRSYGSYKTYIIYKTGDLARWLDDGNIEFLGRIDHQVKIRGQRIELGEIENQLLEHENIKEAVINCLTDKTGGKSLCAYIVCDHNIPVSQLREYLLRHLPGFMVPANYVILDKIPVTANGKVDRNALPDPEGISLREDVAYTLPSSPVEKKLVEIWQEVLGRKNISIDENFFMIGGDSIRSIQVISRMSGAGYKLEMKDLFQYPVISKLAPRVTKLKRIPDQSVITGTIPLTPIQRMLFQQSHIDPHHYNQAVMFYSKSELEKEIVRKVFTKIQEHHDALRMTYKINPGNDGNGVNDTVPQINHGLNYPLSLDEYDLRNRETGLEELNMKVNEIQASIDFENGPLMKLGLFHMDDGDRLLIVIHHMVIDGVSWRILFEDIETLYNQYRQGKSFALPAKSDSFKLWSEKQSVYANSKIFLKEKNYWKKLESFESLVPQIPKDYQEVDNYFKDGVSLSFSLTEEDTERLLTKVNEVFKTEINDILLTALGVGIKRTFGQERVSIALEGHGREEILEGIDISRTVGWFTSVYPVLLDICYPDQPGRQIKEIKETLRRIPNKGMGYGILKYLSGEENKKEIEFKLKPQISFNYLGQFDTEVKQISSFEIAKESAGNPQSSNNKRDYLLDVSGIVTNNRLTMSISYNKTHFKPDTIPPLLRNFETELINIIEYCCAKEEKEPTPSDFTYKGLSIENIDRLITLYPNLEDLYTLSPMQEGMLFHALADDSSYSYFEQASYRLQGELEIHLVKKSLNELFNRHDILRTAFVYQNIERPVQLVLRDRNIDFYYQDISNLETRGAKETFISEFKANDKNRSFDLSKDVLMRVAILQVENSEYEFTWSFHHILMDGWCLGILNSDFFEIYNANRENIPYRLPGINPYRTYIMWLEKKDNEESTRYWQNYLDSFEEQTGIPTVVIETSTKEEKRYKNEMVSIVLDMEKTAGLNKLAAENHVTLNIVTQTLWGILLGKYNGREDVVFGTVVSGRPSDLEGVESMVGLFINTIPVRIHFEYKMKFYILVQQVQREALDSEPHHYHPLPEIQALTTLKQNLIDHIFVFENYPIAEQIKGYEKKKNKQNKTSIKLDKVEVFEQTNYDFNVILGGSDRLSITFQYNGNVYNEEFIERIVGQFCTLVDQVIKKKELEVGELTLLSEEEKNRILYEFNNTAAEYPKNKTIHQLFKEQAERIPDNIALVGAGSQTCPVCITYHQLDTQSDQLARLLIEKGVLPDTIVAIMMEPSVEMIIGIMGILKSGGAYLPIDLEYPRERIDYMLADSNAKVLLGMEEYWNKITVNCQLLIVNCKLKSMPQAPFHHSSFIIHHSGHLAYIIYTSGSTGRPKGVMINHKSFTDFTTWAVDEFEHRVGYQVLLSNSFASDGSIQQIFPPLISGGVLHVITKELRLDVARYLDYLKVQRVNNIDEVPVLMKELVSLIDPADPEEKLPDLTCLSLGSEYVPIDLIRKCRQHINHHGRIINAYGPAEASVETTTYHCDGTSEGEQSLIGKPRRNIKVYILDKRGQCCPIGVQGEICVGGVGLARGYLNQPELTAERFKFNRSYESYILYKTGDMGSWLPDGNIEFIGRIDNQVKIRGFRVELAEIENRLLNVSGVKEALVLEGGEAPDEKYLCAYFVSTREFKIAEFRGYLAKDLPDYMIPSYFMRLEKIPLTPNGKIDRNALPKPKLEIDQNYTAARDDIEKRLVKIWSEILSRGEEQISIGIDDNFFRLGGHSLKATIMMSKIHKELNVKVELMNIFRTPTIRDIAQLIRGLKKEEFQAIEPVEKKEYYPLSSAQKRLFFLQQLDLDSISYNIPMVLPLGKEIKADKLEYAFKQLINRHESLRTSIERVNDVVVQRIHESVEFEIEYFAADAGGVGEQTQTLLTNFIRPFDYSKAPLIRSGLIMLPGGNCVWIVDIHHIVSDGTSHTILTEDFLHFYETGMSLEPLPIQYKDFAQWQNQLFASGRIKDQEDYWMQLYSGEIPRLNLATDYKRPVVFTFQGDYHMLKLEREDTVRFKALGARHGGTLYMNIMAALNTLFYKYTGQTDIILGSGIAGRQHADIQGVVGMFVNTLAMRNYPDGQKPYETFLAEVIANSIKGFENQDVQFEELVDKLDPERDPSRNPLFDILMVVQNFREVDSTISLEQVIALDEYSPAIEYKNPTSKFDLTFFVHEQNEDVYIYIEYYTGIFKLDTIRRLDSHFKHVVKTVIAEPTIKLREIEIISEEEKQQVLFEFNDTIRDYPWEKSIPVLFEEQVERTPDHIALVGVGLRLYRSYLTYRELHEQSNRLANYLYYGNRVAPDQPVGIMMNRSLEMITAVLAILKAGAAYTPISPSYPLERIKKMINDAGIKILLSQKRYIKNLNRLQWECGANLKTFFCIDSSNVYGEEEAEENQLMSRKLWEYVGETAVDEVTGGGWNSSYTGEPIPKEEMDEYGDNVLRKLESLLHKQMRVLEIGSASGISMYRIAPRVGLYFGTDISGVIIEKNKRRIMEEGHKNIKLLRAAAHEIDRLNELGEKDFDLVIINSVIQCFHGHNYLRNVIRKAIDLMGNRGYLFIGDIMDQDLKEDLITDMMRFKHENSGMGYKTKTDWSEELFISRSFLEDLAWDYPEIYDMEFSEKIHTIENELTRFRYDALIKIDRSGKERKKIKRDHRYKTGHDLRELKNFRAEQLGIGLGGDNLAYVIYTSGSTGIPKGVMVDHRNVVRLVKNANFIELRADDRILQTGALEFDASTLEIWGALLNGLVLVLESKENILEAGILKEITTKHKISLMWMTSSFFNQVLDEDVEVFKGLRYLLVGGEALSSSHINRLRSRYPKHNVINGYGPTENTTFSTTLLIDKEYTENIPIGKPIANSLAYVLDRDCNLLPPGVAGELYVGGEGVARGYLNSPELTSEKFKHDLGDCRGYHDRKSKSFFKDPGTRGAGSLLGFYKKAPLVFYKTGDLARWLSNGVIEFLGRIDSQVKIRGYRIEMQEIENRLLKVEQVKEAVVIDQVDTSGSKYLCAYVVIEENSLLADLRDLLSKDFPDYMIPTYFIPMKAIPLTANGKVDRRALPGPEVAYLDENAYGAGAHKAPRNEIENKLVEIWHDVLSLPHLNIGIEDNFFELGGHSLKATILVSKIHKEFDVKVPLAQIFKTPSIMGLAEFIRQAEESRFFSISTVEKKEYYALSSAQKRIYILQQMETGGTTYNMPAILLLEGVLDRDKFESIFERLIQRHESLRTSFYLVNDAPVQKIDDKVEFEIEYTDLATDEHGQTRTFLMSFIRPFELSKSPLLRVGLAKEKEDRHILMVDMHHIISDGTSINILVSDFMSLYQGDDLPELMVQYKDFSEWQNSEKQKDSIKRQEDSWIKKFEGEIPVLALPLDYARPSIQSFEGGNFHFEIDKEASGVLKKLTLETDTTMYMVLLALYTVFLSKVTGQEDIVVGTPIAGRRHTDLEKIIGMFVNTLALRNYPSETKRFTEFLQEVKEKTLSAFENQDYQFEDLVERVVTNRDISRNPLFDVMFVLQNIEMSEVELSGLVLKPYGYEDKTAKFDLTLTGVEATGKLFFTFEYSTNLFREETINRFSAYFKNIVNQVIDDRSRRISDIEIITAEEKKKVLYDFNDTEAEYPKDKTIYQLFTEQAERIPDNIALVGAGSQTCPITLSYNKLNEQSDRLAVLLLEKGVLPDNIVGIMMERSAEMIIAILGILKSGGAYMPIDPAYPQERIDYMLKDSNAKKLAVANDQEGEKVGRWEGERVLLESIFCDSNHLKGRPRRGLHHSNQVAYIIYTSGSTGKPKGVMVEQQSVVNYIWWAAKCYVKGERVNFPLYTSISFDLTVTSIYTPLITGNAVVIYGENETDKVLLIERIIEEDIVGVVKLTPSHLKIIKEKAVYKEAMILKRFIVGGEILDRQLALAIHEVFKGKVEIYNEYGPTEATVGCMIYKFDPLKDSGASVPIGIPGDNSRIYILDKYQVAVPTGVTGELYISGAGIARGYLNRPELTAERFIEYRSDRSYKTYIIYKTGDLARWLPDGNIEFFGRVDQQVKIRGYRIELGEIENCLLKASEVKEAVVLARTEDEGNKYLCAYIVGDSELGMSELRKSLVKELPDYMIPSYFVQLEKIPLTTNGKVDRKALPRPEEISLRENVGYTLPSSDMEKKLVEIWEKVLGRNNISTNENFFMLGGDSIKAIQIISRMSSAGYKMEMKDLFQYPVIANLAPRVKKLQRIPDQSFITGTIPLTPIQASFFTRPLGYRHHYNHAVMLYFAEEIGEETVRAIFSKIQEHHDALRMSYIITEGRIIQTNHGLEYPLSLQIYDLRAHENAGAIIGENAESIEASIDLEKGPMMKLGLFHCQEGDYLLIVIHHLVIDGISWRILFEDIDTLYHQFKNSVPLVLPPKTDSFKLWSEQQVEYAQSSLFLKEKNYWGALEQNPAPIIKTDFAGDNFYKDTDSLSFILSEETTTTLLGKVNEALGTEINDILLTALGLSISSVYGINRVLVALEGHGREKIFKDIDITRTVGWFTSVYPVILDMSYKNDLSRQIKEVKEHLHQLPHRGIGYGILKYLTDRRYKEDIEFCLNPQICFNYLGQFDTDTKQSTFAIANQPMGNTLDPRNQREYQLDVSGMVSGHCLTMSIDYSKTLFKKESIEKLSGQFKQELLRIISHCTAQDKKQLTPSDFAYKNLSFKDLNEINKLFNKN